MSVIPEVKCRRCGETFSSLRSRCPNCGTRRVTQSGRTPGTTPGTVRGTVAYERAETNTKWQIIFGLILVVAVILAVIVMVSTSLEGADKAKENNNLLTPPVVTNAPPEVDQAPTPPPTPTPTVESIRLMNFTNELGTDITMYVGETVSLTAQVLPLTIEGAKVTWKSANEDIIKITVVDDLNCTLECLDHMAGGVEITAECLGITTTLRIYTNGQG